VYHVLLHLWPLPGPTTTPLLSKSESLHRNCSCKNHKHVISTAPEEYPVLVIDTSLSHSHCCIMQHPMRFLLVIFTLLSIFSLMSDIFCCTPCEHSFNTCRGLKCHCSCCVHHQEHRALQSDLPYKCLWVNVSRASKKVRVELDTVGYQKLFEAL